MDTLDGEVHHAYGPLPNALYLIDSTGHIAFRALFAGQEGLIRRNLEKLLEQEFEGYLPAKLGQQKNLIIPLMKSMRHFDHAVARAGHKAEEDFKREMGGTMYAFEKMMSKDQ